MKHMKINGKRVSSQELQKFVVFKNQMRNFAKEMVIEERIKEIDLSENEKKEAMETFKKANNIQSEDDLKRFTITNYVNIEICSDLAERNVKIEKFREEKWGPQVNSLYLQNKDEFDYVVYHELKSAKTNTLQEIYFRIKDKETTWETLRNQLSTNKDYQFTVRGPKLMRDTNKAIRQKLRTSKVGKIIEPFKFGDETMLIELIELTAPDFDGRLRYRLMLEAYNKWLEQEATSILKNLTFEND